MVVGHRPLTQLGDETLISRSEMSEPYDMYPILPTVDLQQKTSYRKGNGGGGNTYICTESSFLIFYLLGYYTVDTRL